MKRSEVDRNFLTTCGLFDGRNIAILNHLENVTENSIISLQLCY